MNAKELKRLLRKQTGCSYRRMIIQDKNYNALQPGAMKRYLKMYNRFDYYDYGEEYDCDDVARDLWNFMKRRARIERKENGAVGLLILNDHTQLVCARIEYAQKTPHSVYYLDQRDSTINRPNEKPKWIIM